MPLFIFNLNKIEVNFSDMNHIDDVEHYLFFISFTDIVNDLKENT